MDGSDWGLTIGGNSCNRSPGRPQPGGTNGSAQSPRATRRPCRDLLWRPPYLAGEITEIGEGEFTVTIDGNSQIVVEVSEFTSYLGELESFSDLEIGLEVAVIGHRSGKGTLVARVVATRDDLPLGTQIGGEGTVVGTDSISIETRGYRSRQSCDDALRASE
jgi:hypothetical protein